MSTRYPYDAEDSTGAAVETNNASLVADGERTSPAVRLPTASDPCKAYVINAPTKQLRDRLALLESKVPLLDEAADINDGDLAIAGNITAQGQTVVSTRTIPIAASGSWAEDLTSDITTHFWLNGLTFDSAAGTPRAEGAVVTITGDASYTANASGDFYAEDGTTLLGKLSFLVEVNETCVIIFQWANKFNGSLTYATGASEQVDGVVSARRVEAQETELTTAKTIGSVAYTNTLEADGEGVTFTRAEELSGNYQQDVRFTVQPQYDSTNGARIECEAHSYDADGSMGDKLGVTLKTAALRTNSIGEDDDQCGQITVNTPELLVNGDVGATGNVNAEGDVTAGGGVTAGGDVAVTGDITASGDITAGNFLGVGAIKMFIRFFVTGFSTTGTGGNVISTPNFSYPPKGGFGYSYQSSSGIIPEFASSNIAIFNTSTGTIAEGIIDGGILKFKGLYSDYSTWIAISF